MRMLPPLLQLGAALLLELVRTGQGAGTSAQALTGACAAADPDELSRLDGGQCLFASDFFQQCVVYLRAKNTTCNDWCSSQGSTAMTAGWQCAGGWSQYPSGQESAMPQRRLDGVAVQDECLGGCDLGCSTPSQSEYMVCRCKETSSVDAVHQLADDALNQLLANSPGVPGASISTESDAAIVQVTIMTADHADSTGGFSAVAIPDTPVAVEVPASAIRKYGGTVALVVAAFKEQSAVSDQSVADSNGSAISHLGAPVSVQFATGADGYLSVDGLEDPIRVTITRPTGLDHVDWDCGYFHEGTGLWTTENVQLEETGSGHLVCTTQHLTFFAAVGRSFIDVLRCSNAYLLDGQAVKQIGKGSWAYEPAAVFLWFVCILHLLLCSGAVRFDLRAHEEGFWVDEHFLREKPLAEPVPEERVKAGRSQTAGKALTRRLSGQGLKVKEKLQEKRKDLPARGEFKTWLRAQVNAYCIKQIVAYHMWISPRDMRSLLDWLEEEEEKERSTITDAVSRETTEQMPGVPGFEMNVRAQGSKDTVGDSSTRPPSRHASKDPSVLGSKQASSNGQTPTPSQRSVWGQSVSSQREMLQSGTEPDGLQIRADEAAGRPPQVQVYEEMPQAAPRTGDAPSSFLDMWWDYVWGSGRLAGRCLHDREVDEPPQLQKVEAVRATGEPEEVPIEDCLTPMSSQEPVAAAPVFVAEEPDIPEQRHSKTSRATPTTPVPEEMSVNILARIMTRKRFPRNQPEDNNVQGEMQTWRTMDTNNSNHSRSGSKEPVLKAFAKPLKEQLEKNHEQYFAERSSRRYATGMLCFGLQPWLSLYRYSIFDSSTTRALHLTSEVFGALLFAAFFFGIDAPSVESPADCDNGSWTDDLWGEVLAAFFGFWFALVPRLILGLLGKRSFKDLPDQQAIDKQLRSWLIQDIIKWVFGTCYIIFSLVYILIFLSNTKIDSGFSWVAASLIEELLLNLFVPVSIAMAYLLLDITSVRSEEDYAKARERLGLRQMQQLQDMHRSGLLQKWGTHISV